MKLKIKAKKLADQSIEGKIVETAVIRPVQNTVTVQTPTTDQTSKKPAFTPAISFEAAPKIVPAQITPPRTPSNGFAPRDKKYVVNNNRPFSPRNTGAQTSAADAQRRPVNPSTPSTPTFQYDPKTSYKPRKPMTPRISFEPAPKIHVPERTADTGARKTFPGNV